MKRNLPLFNGRTREIYERGVSVVQKDIGWILEGGSARVIFWRAIYTLDDKTKGRLFRGRLRGGRRWPRS